MMRVNIKSYQVVKLILTSFVVVQENIKQLNAQILQARSVFLIPRAKYFPAQHKTGLYAHITVSTSVRNESVVAVSVQAKRRN